MRLACISLILFLAVSAPAPSLAGQAGAGTASVVVDPSKLGVQPWMTCLGQAVINRPIATSDEGIADEAFRLCRASELAMDRATAGAYQGAGVAGRANDDLMAFKAQVRSELLKEIVNIRTGRTRMIAAENAQRRWMNCLNDRTRDSTRSAKATAESGFSACLSEEAAFAALASDNPVERAKIVKDIRDKVQRDLQDLQSGW